MADHTPTPWGLNKYNELVDAAGENIRAKGFALTNTAEAHSNTAFIHRAVNAHDDLVKALEAVLEVSRGTSGRIILEREDEETIRAALAKAAS